MCTVTYFPGPGKDFILSSSRDEFPERKIAGIARRDTPNGTIVFPQDAWAGGSWIAADGRGRVLCLLNGAFEGHERILPYRKSRGIMLLELMEAADIPGSFSEYPLEGIEPFTLILATRNTLFTFCWDSVQRHLKEFNPAAPHIWSSPTLYDRDARRRREYWFDTWCSEQQDFSREAILDFHCSAGKGDAYNGLVIERDGIVRTVSITQVVVENAGSSFFYFDLNKGKPELLRKELLVTGERL